MFAFGFGDVHVDRAAQGLIGFSERAAEFFVREIFAMHANVVANQIGRIIPLGEGDTFGEAVGRDVIFFGEGEADAAQICTHAQARQNCRAFIGKVVHVGDARRATRPHFKAAPGHARGDVFGFHFRFNREDGFFEPTLQGKARADATEQGHGCVAMGVDEPWHHKARRPRQIFG